MLFDNIGQSFLDRAVELVKSGYRFVFVLDNIDWEEKAHDMRKDNQNTSVHAVAASIVFNRIPNEELPDSEPQQDLRKCNVNQLVKVTASEMDCIRKRYRTFVQDILFEHFPFFSTFKLSLFDEGTYCHYSDEMAKKSETITMPILMKDEKKYAECVDVMDTLEGVDTPNIFCCWIVPIKQINPSLRCKFRPLSTYLFGFNCCSLSTSTAATF